MNMLLGQQQPQQTPATTAGEVIFDVGVADFEERVLKASMERPVIVDFWAPWCGPCKQLTPVLEKVVTAANGEVLLAKINMDENQELAAALRIQSIPTIYAFFGGRPVDAFQGSLPENQIKAFVDKLVQVARQAAPDAIDIPEALKAAAEVLAAGDLNTAQAIYMQVLSQDEKNVQAFVGLVRTLIAAGQTEQAAQMVADAPEEISKESSFAEARTAIELAQVKPPSGAIEKIAADVAKNPNDHQARFDLALAQFTSGLKEEGIESLLEIVRRKRDWNEGEARTQLLKFFEALGPADPLTVASRRKLSSLLFS
jgi:putative thioredoxin